MVPGSLAHLFSLIFAIIPEPRYRVHWLTLQYLMGHSDISVTMNVYTHISFDDAEEELKRMEEFRKAQAEIEKKNENPMSQKMFKAI